MKEKRKRKVRVRKKEIKKVMHGQTYKETDRCNNIQTKRQTEILMGRVKKNKNNV